MSRKRDRNQFLQAGKAEKGYGGYLPSVQGPRGLSRVAVDPDRPAEKDAPRLELPEPGEAGRVSGVPVRDVPAGAQPSDRGR